MNTVTFILIYMSVFVAVFVLCCLLVKLMSWLKSKNLSIPKTFKRILWVLLGVVVCIVIGYFVFTGFQV